MVAIMMLGGNLKPTVTASGMTPTRKDAAESLPVATGTGRPTADDLPVPVPVARRPRALSG
jgi:hypothetical protein